VLTPPPTRTGVGHFKYKDGHTVTEKNLDVLPEGTYTGFDDSSLEGDDVLTPEQEEALNALVAARKVAVSPVYAPDMELMAEAGIYQGTNPQEVLTAAKLARFFSRLADALKVSIDADV
jgi:hypothetical protein